MAPPVKQPPDTLPADFFEKQPPDTLPADFKFDTAGTGQGESPNYGRDVQTVTPTLGQVGKGVMREGANLLSGGYSFGRRALELIPGIKGSGFDQSMNEHQATLDTLAKPQNMGEAMGRTGAEMASYLAPAKAETTLAEAVPKAWQPLARIGIGAMSGGAMSGMNRGDVTTGAVAGGIAGGIGEGLRAAAPKLAESAIGITKADRAFGKMPGRAILDETRGIRPTTIAESGQAALNKINPEVERMADAASVRANRLRGLLQAPQQEIPLAEPFIPDTKGELIPAARLPQGNITGAGTDLSPTGTANRTRGVPGRNVAQMGSMAQTIPARLQREAYVTAGEHEAADLPRSGPGVLLRRPEAQGGPVPTLVSNPIASMRPARQVVGNAAGKAAREEAGSLHGQLGELQDFLHKGKVSGEPIPEDVTPRRLLDLQRGFSKEFLGRWNPETHGDTLAAGRQAYRAMGNELDRTVPEAQQFRRRMANLIPVVHRAESTARNAPLAQKVVGRFVAPTGALTAAAFGASEGAKHGLGGAIAGGMTGLVTPLVAGTPEGQMLLARAFNSPLTGKALRAAAIPPAQALVRALREQKKGTGGQGQ